MPNLKLLLDFLISLILIFTHNAPFFAFSLVILLGLCLLTGFSFILISDLLKKKWVYRWEIFGLSLLFGFPFLCILLYGGTLLKLSSIHIAVGLILINLVYIINKIRNKQVSFDILPLNRQRKIKFVIPIALVLLFLYYAIQPLTLEYGFARDYDAAALGLKLTGNFVLPVYNIQTYYPPLVATIGAHFSNLFGHIFSANINKVMLVIFSLAIFLIAIASYFIGFFFTRSRIAGGCFLIMFSFIAATRNAVIGGSTYPALLGNLFFALFILMLIEFFSNRNKKAAIFSGIFLAGICLSHLDIGFSAFWFCCAALTIGIIYYRPKKEIAIFIVYSLLITGFLTCEYFWYGFINKGKFSGIWAESLWLAKIHGESQPKSLNEIAFFSGLTACLIVAASLIAYLCCIIKRKSNELWLYLLFIFWCCFLSLQNSYFMLYATRPFIHIYPLNIIMWTGLLIFLVCSGGYGLYFIFSFLNKINKIYAKAFIILLFFASALLVIDYESINLQGVFRPGGGYFWSAISEKSVIITRGDNTVLDWLRKQNTDGSILVPDTYAGYYCSVATEKKSTLAFYEPESYHDPSYRFMISGLIKDTVNFFQEPNSSRSLAFLKKHNISYIYLPASQAAEFTENKDQMKINLCYDPSLFSNNFFVVKRAGGAKIIKFIGQSQDIGKGRVKLQHIEAESYASKAAIKECFYPKSIFRKTALVSLESPLTIPLEMQNFIAPSLKGLILYIKHSTSPIPARLKLSLGKYSRIISVRTNKFKFSESKIEIPFEAYAGMVDPIKLQLSVVPEKQNLLNKIYTVFPIEVDWIEIEQNK